MHHFPMKKYEYLPHTADAEFRAYGKTMEEAFINAALAMANLTYDTKIIKPLMQKEIHVNGDTFQELVLHFLDEFIFLQDTEGFLLHDVVTLKITKGIPIKQIPIKLIALVQCDHYKKYEMHGQLVKAATYNEMLIEQKKDQCMIQIVVDI